MVCYFTGSRRADFFLWLVLSGAAFAQGSDRIFYYEIATQVELQKRPDVGVTSKPGIVPHTSFRFRAFDRTFDIALYPNERLVAKLRPTRKLPAELGIFRGSIVGLPGSWARFSLLDGRMAGVVWDGSELFLIDRADMLRVQISGTPADNDTLVFRASDVRLQTDDPVHYSNGGKTIRGDLLIAETKQLMRQKAANAALPSRGIPLGLILDANFPDKEDEESALFPTNIADGIHSEQVNLHLDLEHILRFDYANDPFDSNDAEILLGQLPGIKSASADLAPLGIAHFLTRRNVCAILATSMAENRTTWM